MTVELAVMTPVVIVIALVVLNLMGYVEACAAFDQAAQDAVIAQGVAPAGSQNEARATEEVRSLLEDLLGREDRCEVEVRAEAVSGGAEGSFVISPLLTRYVCTVHGRAFCGFPGSRTRHRSPSGTSASWSWTDIDQGW